MLTGSVLYSRYSTAVMLTWGKLGSCWLLRLCWREINLTLQHLNAGQSLSLMHSDLANKPLSYKCKFPGSPGIWLIVLQALRPDRMQKTKNASKWNGCILQLSCLTKRIVSKEFKTLDNKKFVSQSKYLMHTYIMKRIHNLPLLLLRLQNVNMLNANTEGNLCENENLKQIWERRETLLQTSWLVYQKALLCRVKGKCSLLTELWNYSNTQEEKLPTDNAAVIFLFPFSDWMVRTFDCCISQRIISETRAVTAKNQNNELKETKMLCKVETNCGVRWWFGVSIIGSGVVT